MFNVKIFEPGYQRCVTAAKMVQAAAGQAGTTATAANVDGPAASAISGIVSMPDVAIDGMAGHAGGLPKHDEFAKWLIALPIEV